MSSHTEDELAVAEVVKFLRHMSNETPNVDVQMHALSLAHDFTIFQELKKWSTEIMESGQDPAAKAGALSNLRMVGGMTLRSKSSNLT